MPIERAAAKLDSIAEFADADGMVTTLREKTRGDMQDALPLRLAARPFNDNYLLCSPPLLRVAPLRLIRHNIAVSSALERSLCRSVQYSASALKRGPEAPQS